MRRTIGAFLVCLALAGAGCKKASDLENIGPPTPECTALGQHFRAIADQEAGSFEGIPDTPEEWATRWESKCRSERARIDYDCLMKARSSVDVSKCPESPPK